eukprot:scpid94037/ scgid8541/ 
MRREATLDGESVQPYWCRRICQRSGRGAAFRAAPCLSSLHFSAVLAHWRSTPTVSSLPMKHHIDCKLADDRTAKHILMDIMHIGVGTICECRCCFVHGVVRAPGDDGAGVYAVCASCPLTVSMLMMK